MLKNLLWTTTNLLTHRLRKPSESLFPAEKEEPFLLELLQ
jgi:hypothetical protein